MASSDWFFFFSSRRRHTRWTGDWSSDVCSSDLKILKSNVIRIRGSIRLLFIILCLTRIRSATAGENGARGKRCGMDGKPERGSIGDVRINERGLQWTSYHKGKRGIRAASGWLHRLVRCSGAVSAVDRTT